MSATAAPGSEHLAALEARRAALEARVAAATTPELHDQLRAEIAALYRETDAQLTEWTAFKDAVRALGAQWRDVALGRPATASRRVDHLGASTYVEKGWSLLAQEDAAGAESALRRALSLAPGHLDAEALLAWSELEQGRPTDALLTAQGVLLRAPDHPMSRVVIGFACLRSGRPADAGAQLLAAARQSRDRRAAMFAQLGLGMAAAARGAAGEAEAAFERALELGPNLAQAWYELGWLRWRGGRPEAATTAWRQGAIANRFTPWGKRCAQLAETVEAGGTP